MGRDTMSGQAVGGALAHNPVSIIIPCHRVVGSGGSLTGYLKRSGTEDLAAEYEGVDVSPVFGSGEGDGALRGGYHGVEGWKNKVLGGPILGMSGISIITIMSGAFRFMMTGSCLRC